MNNEQANTCADCGGIPDDYRHQRVPGGMAFHSAGGHDFVPRRAPANAAGGQQARIHALQTALAEVLLTLEGGPRASIGAVNNTYAPQISAAAVTKWKRVLYENGSSSQEAPAFEAPVLEALRALANAQWPYTWAEPCDLVKTDGGPTVCVTHGQNTPCPMPAVAACLSGHRQTQEDK